MQDAAHLLDKRAALVKKNLKGTRLLPWQRETASIEEDIVDGKHVNGIFMSLSVLPEYSLKSHEELRFEDYQFGRPSTSCDPQNISADRKGPAYGQGRASRWGQPGAALTGQLPAVAEKAFPSSENRKGPFDNMFQPLDDLLPMPAKEKAPMLPSVVVPTTQVNSKANAAAEALPTEDKAGRVQLPPTTLKSFAPVM